MRSGITDPGLEESLRLIRESAEQSRELLVAVGDLLQPAEPEEELVEVQTLVEEAAKMLSLLLPRSVKLETTGLERNNSVISVLRGDFLRNILALVAMDVGSLRVPSGTIRLGCAREGESVRVVYRSIVGSASKLRERAPELLTNLSSGVRGRGQRRRGRIRFDHDIPARRRSLKGSVKTILQAWNRHRRYSSSTMTWVVLRTLQDQLSRDRYRVAAIPNVKDALQRLRDRAFWHHLGGPIHARDAGLEFLQACRECQPLSSRIIVTEMTSLPEIEEALARGDAFRFLLKPWTRFDLTLALIQATDRFRLLEQLETTSRESHRQQSDLAALVSQLESYRQQLRAAQAQHRFDPRSEEIFLQIISHIDQAIWVSDAESNQILYVSPVHEQIWGRSLQELYGANGSWIDTIHPDDRERVLKAALEDQTTGKYDEQYRILRPDGEIRWIRDRAFPIRERPAGDLSNCRFRRGHY